MIIGTHSESNAAFFLQKMKFIKARPAKKVVALKKSVDKKINEPKKETTQVMLKFQELLNNSSFTRIFVLASEEPSAMFFTDSFYN